MSETKSARWGRAFTRGGYPWILGAAAAARLALELTAVSFVSEAQRRVWSWAAFAVFALALVAAAALAERAGLLNPAEATARLATLAWPAAVGATVALLTIVSDWVAPVAAARGVATVHVEGWPALPFYLYGAILLTTLFHFLPMSLAAWLARGLDRRRRRVVLGAAVVVVALSEDAGYLFGGGWTPGIDALRHLLSVAANATEAVFVLRWGLLGGLAQRLTTYLLWHLAWPLLGTP